MAEEAAVEDSDISDFEIDDEIKEELNSLMNLDFIETSSSDDEARHEKETAKKGDERPEKSEERRSRGDSLERELEMMFMSQHVKEVPVGAEEGASKDTGLESISDNELDGPESGECDTSDGELPDSPNIVVTVPDTPPINHVQGVEDLSGSSDVELLQEYQGREGEYYEPPQKPSREVIIESREPVVKKKEKSPSKSKDKGVDKVKKDKKDKSKKKCDLELTVEEKRRLKFEKYMARLEMYKAKCLVYVKQITKETDYMKKNDKTKIRLEKGKNKNVVSGDSTRLKSIVKEVIRDISPQSSTSSKFDRSSHSSKADKSPASEMHGKRSSSDKERKSKHKKSKSKSKELKEHRLLYQEYLHYLQLEREKCLEEGFLKSEKPKKIKKRKTKSKSPDKKKELPVIKKTNHPPPILSFSEFCNNRELVSPDRDTSKSINKIKISNDVEGRKERTISVDSAATTATVRSDPVDPVDDDKELFITISDLEQQDKQNKEKQIIEIDKEKIESELERDPELKSMSVFTSVLFKGGSDSEVIPFLSSENRPSSPKPAEMKPKKPFIQDTGIDEIYDMNDDLSNISQSSLSPSRSPAPKLHNKALLNYLENQKEREEGLKKKSPEDKSKPSSRSRSKSPRRERSRSKKRKRKHHSSISTVSPSPPPLRPRTPENVYRKRPSPPAYLKERWKDYPSPPEHRLSKREHRLTSLVRRRSRSRTRKVHRSRSSSEERERHYRRYKSRSRSRSRSPPVLTMVQLTSAEKRRKLREEHERALASLRETIRKPLSNTPLSITITNHGGDNFEAICDNYDPVGMNEDSSSNSPSEVDVMTEPSLPPLPPEPPPPKPAPPSVEKREDLTVVTTYTSFLPLTNSNIPPPMGYDVPFNNWLPPVADIQHPNVMFPPPMMNSFSNPPPQQHFPFMNQPPPPLPYQMSMPPPCHQHYRMQGQAPNIVSIRQDVKNIKSNPIVISDIDDDRNTHLEGSKCKHNPLGQNNQTVQEAIDSVKKCLKNCDALKNKDPRLALPERKKSPERSKLSPKFDDKKVKITLNYKPRPVSDAEQTCVFETANDESDSKSSRSEPSKVPNDYTEKNSKIEGIVSKLKDNINTCYGPSPEEVDKADSQRHSTANKSPGDEPYDPFNVNDEISDNSANHEEIKINSSNIQNDRRQTVVLNSSMTSRLSQSEVENINDQINKSFSFILSHSIERKRLTPTLSNIVAKKAEKQKKSEYDDKTLSMSKICQMNQEFQKSKNKKTDSITHIKTSFTHTVEMSNVFNVSFPNKEKANNPKFGLSQPTSKTNANESQENIDNSYVTSKSGVHKTQNRNEVHLAKDLTTQSDCNKHRKGGIERETLHFSSSEKFNNGENLESNKCSTQASIQKYEAENKITDKKVNMCIEKNVIGIGKSKSLYDFVEKVSCDRNNIYIEDGTKQHEICSTNSKLHIGQKSLEKQEAPLDTNCNSLCEDTTQNVYQDGTNEHGFGRNASLIEKHESQIPHGKKIFGESKNHYSTKRRSNPPLSIPTKGELKRFPTPERNVPNTSKTELCSYTKHNESKTQNKILARPKECKEDLEEKSDTKEVTEPPPSKIVESILHDFEESNSFGCDIQPVIRDDKTTENAIDCTKSKRNAIESCIDLKNPSPNVSCSLAKMENHNQFLNNSGLNADLSQALCDEDNSLTLNCDDLSSAVDLIKKDELNKQSDDSRESDQSDVKENVRNRIVRRSQRKSKVSKCNISNDENYESSNHSSTATQNIENEQFLNMLVEDTNKEENLSDTKTDQNDITLHNFPPKHYKEIISSSKANGKQVQPCPLSKKSKSYISHNLPLSFDLSVDGHLIRRGFKNLRVSLYTLEQPPSTAGSSEVSSTCLHGANSDSDCCLDLVSDNNTEILHKNNTVEKENFMKTTNEKPKKRVSFDLNVSEILDDFKSLSDDENALITRSGDEPDNVIVWSSGSSKIIESSDESLHLEGSHDNSVVCVSEAENIDVTNTCTSSDCIVTNPVESPGHENPPKSLSSLYEEIAKTLVTLKDLPLPPISEKKAVVSIPSPNEMPEMTILSSPKKVTKSDLNNLSLQETNEDPRQLVGVKHDEENSTTELCEDRNRSKIDSLKKHSTGALKAKGSVASEVCGSDNDDSIVLDKELSDLAKGCLDSDSNVGEDDDSVLNFGMAVSEDSSADGEFDFNCKNIENSNSLTRQQNKLSSPQNIKKRFNKKLRSANVNDKSKTCYNTSLDTIREEHKEDCEKLRQSQATFDVPSKDTENMTQTLEGVPEKLPFIEPIGDREELFDEEVTESPSTESKVNNNFRSHVSLKNSNNHGKTIRRISKRQKNQFKKSLKEHETKVKDDTSCVDGTASTTEIEERNTHENEVLDPISGKGEYKEITSLNDITNCSNQDSEKPSNNNNRTNNNIQNDDVKSETVDSNNYPREDLTANSIINNDVTSIVDSEIIPDKNTTKPRNTQKSKRNYDTCNPVKPDSVEQKLSSPRKSRRGKLLEQDILNQTQHMNSEEKDSQLLDTKVKGNVNEFPNTRRTRSAKLFDNDSLSDVEKVSVQDRTKLQEGPTIKDNYCEKQIKKSECISVKETIQEANPEKLSKREQLVFRKNMCVKENINQTEEARNENVSDEEIFTIKSLNENVKDSNKSEFVSLDKDFTVCENQMSSNKTKTHNDTVNSKDVKKPEDVSSTTAEMTAHNVRKTRLSQRKKGFKSTKGSKVTDVGSSNDKFMQELSEPPSRKTRSKASISESTSENKESIVKDKNDGDSVGSSLESDEIKLDIKEDESDMKNPCIIERTLSMESSDEPLINIKNKLMADKNKNQTESENLAQDCIIKSCEDKIGANISKDLKNEDIKLKCKSSVASGSTSTNHGTLNESNASNDNKNVQDTRSDGNDSYSSNHSSNDRFSNLNNNNIESHLNVKDILSSDNSSSSPIDITTSMKHNVSPPVTNNPKNLFLSMIHQNSSLNPKAKEALRKKRDKAEVDAEIKRRLAEIDELEKLAKSQHANVLEKIGARTRSRNIDEEDDVVSISSDDSLSTSVGTNEATNAVSKLADIGKSEVINEEPTTTQNDMVKTPLRSVPTAKDKSSFSHLIKGSLSILPIETTCRTKKNTSKMESEVKSQRQTKNTMKNISKVCVGNQDNINAEVAIDLPHQATNNVTLEMCKKPVNVDEQRPVTQLGISEPDVSGHIGENLRKNPKDVVSVYQFRESDESEIDEEIHPKQKFNRVCRRRVDIEKETLRVDHASTKQQNHKIKPLELQGKCVRKTKYIPLVHESFPDKSNNSSREPSPFNAQNRNSCELDEHSDNTSDKTSTSNVIPEPDSSTSVIDKSCHHSGSLKTSSVAPKDDDRFLAPVDESSSVVSSNNTSQESDMIPSSPVSGFKQPYRKSMVNRRRRKRRSYFGRCVISGNNLENSPNESFGDNNDHTNSQSEEVVSSSVTTVQIPQDKKKRRRRKTVMDLLMEDSMLSVTRDFPMSPNPYMFSSFYKDIDISNSNSKPNATTESTKTEQNSRKTSEDCGLPLKPDFLAQKLKILEKLKNISRKNRKTRQCRTLVCYNEDSLPESLVESPVGESVPSIGDGGISSHEISAPTNLIENNGDSPKKLVQDSEDFSKTRLNNVIEGVGEKVLTSDTLGNVQNDLPAKIPLKRGRKSKAKCVKTLNNEYETQSETTNNLYNNENSPKETLSSTITGPEDKVFSFQNIPKSNQVELSEFDKLLESNPKDGPRVKLSYNYDPGSPKSPGGDKSDDAPDDFFSSLPSPRQSSDDDSSESENTNQHSSSQYTTRQNISLVNKKYSKKHQEIINEKIICSIPKRKIGKMLPYFGDSSSEDYNEDDNNIDEDIPLAVKITQINDEEKEELYQKSDDDEDFPRSEVSNLLTTSSLLFKKRHNKLRKQNNLLKIIQSGRSTRSKSSNLLGEDTVTTDKWEKVNKNLDDLDHSPNINCESSVQLRKSSRKLKKTNFLCKKSITNIKPFLCEKPVDKQDEKHEKNIGIELYLEQSGDPVPLKRKGRPSKKKEVRENSSETTKQNDQPTTEVATLVESEDQDNSNTYHNSKNNNKTLENDSRLKPTFGSSVSDMKEVNEEYFESTINSKSQEAPKLQLSDLDSAIKKSISLRKTRAKSGKETSDIEVDDESYDINKCENYFNDNTNEDCSLEDLPLNKRAAREKISRKRGRKDLLMDNSVKNARESLDISEESIFKDKDEADPSLEKCFNDSPPPLIRTRARRAKLITSDYNDLDPPSLETPIPLSTDDGKYDFDSSVNAESNLDSVDTLQPESVNVPPRKRGRKPKNANTTTQRKDESEILLQTPNETLSDEANQTKPQENGQQILCKPSTIDVDSYPKKRGRRGRCKINHKKTTSQKYNKDAETDIDSDVETTITGMSNEDDLPVENHRQHEIERGVNNLIEVREDPIDSCSNANFVMQDDGRKRKRKLREEKKETGLVDTTSNNLGENEISNDSGVKKRKTLEHEQKDESRGNEASTSSSSIEEPHSYAGQSCANQPFLWNKISVFLNKSTRSVGTQVKVKNLVLKGFETSEPEVSLQSELTLPQVIKTLFEELRFIDSSFSNS